MSNNALNTVESTYLVVGRGLPLIKVSARRSSHLPSPLQVRSLRDSKSLAVRNEMQHVRAPRDIVSLHSWPDRNHQNNALRLVGWYPVAVATMSAHHINHINQYKLVLCGWYELRDRFNLNIVRLPCLSQLIHPSIHPLTPTTQDPYLTYRNIEPADYNVRHRFRNEPIVRYVLAKNESSDYNNNVDQMVVRRTRGAVDSAGRRLVRVGWLVL